MRSRQMLSLLGAITLAFAGTAHAAVITPLKYPTAATQAADVWYTDRYAPDAFANIGTFQGRDDVLRIGLHADDSQANRPSSFSSAFYNTQGRKYDIGEPFVVSLSASVFLSSDWAAGLIGSASRRTDLWATISPDSNPSCPQSNCNLFPIIGFVSDDDGARFRVWDSNAPVGGWQNLAIGAITLDEWFDLELQWTGVGFEYFINGANVYSDTTIGQVDPSFGNPLLLANVIMQGYNFGETYDAHWSDIQVVTQAVPQPVTLLLLALGVAGLGASSRMRRKAA